MIEQGDIHRTDPEILTRNRYIISRSLQIRIFVEDDLSKARRLADICDVVFLLNHPYNQNCDGQLPRNLMRVDSWDEIYKYVRERL